MSKVFSLGISSCPNDTFIFDALINRKIDTKGITFNVKVADIDELNTLTQEGRLDISKTSYFNYLQIQNTFRLLTSGGAICNDGGPILISKKDIPFYMLEDKTIAIPGIDTTANLLLSLALPHVLQKIPMLFSEIEQAIKDDIVDAGVIIHESRFTYEKKGLFKILDLGEYWKQSTQLPIPLGCIAISRDINQETAVTINDLVKNSVQYALKNRYSSLDFIRKYAIELDDETIHAHINLFVNDFSIDLGEIGKNAVNELFQKAEKAGLSAFPTASIFIND